MNLCIDQGNSRTKIGIFDGDELITTFTYPFLDRSTIADLYSNYRIDACIISSVIQTDDGILHELQKRSQLVIELTHLTPIPINNQYLTPHTLGKDRLAAVIGAAWLQPQTDLLVVDAGTAITYDFIDANQVYWGGNIAPGLSMRLRALHEFTQKLPLVEAQLECDLLGTNTESALTSGAINGIVFEIDGYFNALKIKYPQLSSFLTGGSTFYFYTKLKNPIFAEINLVLIGLNRILQYNEQK